MKVLDVAKVVAVLSIIVLGSAGFGLTNVRQPASNKVGTAGSARVGIVSKNFLDRYGLVFVSADPRSSIFEYKLKRNGLSILLHQQNVAAVVTVLTLYKVGSRNEAVGYTGATHFLEHMMFKGSDHFDPLQHHGIDDVLKPLGGYNNATTWFDRTSYFEVVPSEDLSLCLSFEADRMRNLLLRSSDRASEMTVVRNELERGENEPQVVLENQLFATAYREHPYHHPTIGWRSDVEGVPIARLKQFYQDFYWPNNATVIIVGKFNAQQALKEVVEKFGVIPQSPHPIPPVYTVEPPQEGERRFIVQRGNDLPKVMIGFHTVNAASSDIYPLAVIQSLLGDNLHQASRLYKRLVDTGLAADVSASSYELRDPGLFLLSATVVAGKSPQEIELALLHELTRLQTEPVDSVELARAKSSLVKRLQLSTVDPIGYAELLGEAIAAKDWHFWATYAGRINSVSVYDIERVAKKYFTASNRTVGYYLPKNSQITSAGAPPAVPQDQDASNSLANNIVVTKSDNPPPASSLETTSASYANKLEVTTKSVAITRVAHNDLIDTTQIVRKKLSNGLILVMLPIDGCETVSISGKVNAGDYFASPDKTYVPALVADLLSKGTTTLSKDEFSERLENMGTTLDFDSTNFWASFENVIVPTDTEEFVSILADVLMHPAFKVEELEKSKTIFDSEIKQRMVDTEDVARNALSNRLYTPASVYHDKTFDEQLQELSTISKDDIAAFHATHFSPANTVIAVTGKFDPDHMTAVFEKYFGVWSGSSRAPIVVHPDTQKLSAFRLDIKLPDKENTDIVIGKPSSVSVKSKDYFAALIGNAALGHAPFASRLAVVREKYGFSYDIRSAFLDNTYGWAPWLIECSVNPSNTNKAITTIKQLVAKYVKEGITEQEVKDEARQLAGELLVEFRDPTEIASYLSKYEILGLGPDFLQNFRQHLMTVTKTQVDAAIKLYFPLNNALTVTAGSKDN